MVSWKSIADRAGVYLDDLDCLLRGEATARVANRLGVTMADIEDFIKGSASAKMASRLGVGPMSAADELARMAGREGAIGILIGLLISS
jgi:hypothetical protein